MDLFLISPDQLQIRPNAFYSYFFVKLSRDEAFGYVLVNFRERLPWKKHPLLKFRIQFSVCMQVLCLYKVSLTGKKLLQIKELKFSF